MKLICAWCGTQISETPEAPDLVSHGICKACKEKEMPKSKPGGVDTRLEWLTSKNINGNNEAPPGALERGIMNEGDFVRVKDDYPLEELRGSTGRIRRIWPRVDRIAVTFPYPPGEFHFKKYEVELLERGKDYLRGEA